MQIIYKNENERSHGRKINSVDIVIHIGKLSKFAKRKPIGGFESRNIGI